MNNAGKVWNEKNGNLSESIAMQIIIKIIKIESLTRNAQFIAYKVF